MQEIAASWVDRLDLMLDALVRDRDVHPPDRSIDVRFDDFMADELGVAERVYALAGEPVDRRGAHGDRPNTWPATSAAGSAASRHHARCSASTRATYAPGSRRTSSASWRDVDQRYGKLDHLVEFANRRGAATPGV